jgi:small subunit ribosomal protein S16
MLRIRLSRVGAKKQPSYRVVVADIESKRDGRIVERIGHYNPRVEPMDYVINEDRALYWLSVGAQPSDAVERLLVKQGTIDRLARLRKGEDRAKLVAEFTGEAVAAVVSGTEVDEEE